MKTMNTPPASLPSRQVQSAQVWNRFRRSVVTSLATALIMAVHSSAFGAPLSWDPLLTGSGASAGGGTWNTANTNWYNGAGDGTWASNSEAVFAGSDGTYAVTVGNALTVGNLTFNNSGYTLSAASAFTLSQFTAASVVTVATGKTATIGSNVTYENTNGSTLSITGTAAAGGSAGTLIIDNGGKVDTTHASAILYVGSTANGAGTLRSTTVQVNAGGTLSSASSLVANGLLRVNGGTVSAGTGLIAIGNFADTGMPSSAILTIDGGTVTAGNSGTSGVRFGTSGSTTNTGGTLNLNGGTLNAFRIYSGGTSNSSTVNFNGGTLKATALNNTDFLGTAAIPIKNAIVKTGGAVIDTNNVDVTIFSALTHDAGLGGTADGGLTKNSAGTLTLRGANTYTGATTLNQGTLTVGTGGTLGASTAQLAVNNSNTGAGTAVVLNLATAADTITGSLSGTISTPLSGTNTATINIQTGRNFTVNQTTSGTYAGVIAGAGSFTLGSSSNNTLKLSGTNTYSGGTTVSAGTLLINGSTATTGTMNVSNTGTLGGTGTVGADTILAAGSKLSPGDSSAATLHFTNALDISAATNDSAAFVFTLGTSYDNVVIGGLLTVGTNLLGAADFSFSTGTGFGQNATYTLFSAASHSGTFSNFSVANIGGSGINGTVALSGNDIVLTTVPEPATWALLAFSLTTVMVLRRRSS